MANVYRTSAWSRLEGDNTRDDDRPCGRLSLREYNVYFSVEIAFVALESVEQMNVQPSGACYASHAVHNIPQRP